MRIRSIFLIITITFFLACSYSPKNTNIVNIGNDSIRKNKCNNAAFVKYLQNNFKLNIPSSRHCYIIIPQNGCRMCMNTVVNQLEINWGKFDRTKNTIIVSNLYFLYDSLFNKKINYLSDEVGNIDDLNLPLTNVTLIYTSKEKIDSINSLDSQEGNFILNLIFYK